MNELELKDDAPRPAPETPAQQPARTSAADDVWLLCRACNFPIAPASSRTERGGAHAHTRVNPAGSAFTFGCFAIAPGAALAGPPTDEATWFPGYRWRIALCSGCQVHLGWSFDGGDDAFFGLILGMLTQGALPRA